jgi:hypothetical protein
VEYIDDVFEYGNDDYGVEFVVAERERIVCIYSTICDFAVEVWQVLGLLNPSSFGRYFRNINPNKFVKLFGDSNAEFSDPTTDLKCFSTGRNIF